MNDCSNANIRDQLPDLLHERLSASARAAVIAHVDGCIDCRNELELLRGVRGALTAQTPRVDIAYVVGALPKAPARSAVVASARAPHRRWADWRVAAAVTILIAGGSSVAVLNRASSTVDVDTLPRSVAIAETPTPAAANPSSANTQSGKSSSSAAHDTMGSSEEQNAKSDAGPDGRFGGLSGAQLKALLGEIDRLKAVPVTEPEPVMIKVNDSSPTSSDRL
jgi:hypothetical protein